MQVNADITINDNTLEIKDYNSKVLELDNLILQIDQRDIFWLPSTQEIEFNNSEKIYIFHPRRWSDDLEIKLDSGDTKKVKAEFQEFLNNHQDLKDYYKNLTED